MKINLILHFWILVVLFHGYPGHFPPVVTAGRPNPKFNLQLILLFLLCLDCGCIISQLPQAFFYSRGTWRLRSKNNKINCKLILESRSSYFAATLFNMVPKKTMTTTKQIKNNYLPFPAMISLLVFIYFEGKLLALK